ncbi:hypothetical protein DFJ58DRAFT_878211 [Suillus subalutaceus]|uniref:uncharacterized protein n=1 Tax=Suillus subalutaceus TaxID=48586 RepID=UPI001B8654BE|nr:uncharacterized protein DFJ58DRAFT_878211 [Suillus subalutaceus]KAG1857735.1 hypothetical protein DFJ58DRAFT_878211 [Suillus subalutaceus]
MAIGQGQLGGGNGKALLAVDSELELVHKLVLAMANRTTISSDAATRAGALEALQENTWRDEHLTLLDIVEKDIPHAEFAFLSACHTAIGGEETLNEVIHFARESRSTIEDTSLWFTTSR